MNRLYVEHESTERPRDIITVDVAKDYVRGHEGNIQEILQKTEELANKALIQVEQFYKITLTNKIPILITDREGIDKASGHKTVRWGVGMSTSEGLYLLDPRLYANTAKENGYESETDHTFDPESYFTLIKHELGHEAFTKVCGIPPWERECIRWFNEGIQYFMAGQLKKDVKNFSADFLENGNVNGFYQKSAAVIKRLTEIYGENGFKERLTYTLSGLHNDYIEIKKDMSIPVTPRIKASFENRFEEAFGFAPNAENISRLVTDKE